MWRYGTLYRYIRFTQHGDNMTLKDEINEDREKNEADKDENWKMADEAQLLCNLDRIIDRIDELERDLDNVRAATCTTDDRMIQLEARIDKIKFVTHVAKITPPPEPSEPFPGYKDLIEEAIPVIKEAIAEKKRELDHKVVPMKKSDYEPHEGNRIRDWDISNASIPAEEPED